MTRVNAAAILFGIQVLIRREKDEKKRAGVRSRWGEGIGMRNFLDVDDLYPEIVTGER